MASGNKILAIQGFYNNGNGRIIIGMQRQWRKRVIDRIRRRTAIRHLESENPQKMKKKIHNQLEIRDKHDEIEHRTQENRLKNNQRMQQKSNMEKNRNKEMDRNFDQDD